MPAEIPVPGRPFGGNHRQALRKVGQMQPFLPVEEVFLFQPRQRLLATALRLSQGKGGVDLVDDQGDAVDFMIGDLHPRQHLDTRGKRGAGGGREILADNGITGAPDDGPDLRHDPAFLALGEFQVAVPGRIDLESGDLRPHPDPVRKGPFNGPSQPLLQRQQIDRLTIIFHTPRR